MLVDKDAEDLQEREQRKSSFLDDTTSSQRPYSNIQTSPEISLTHGDIGVSPPIPQRVAPIASISEAMSLGLGRGRVMPTMEGIKFKRPNMASLETGPVWPPPVPTAQTLGQVSRPFPVPSPATATSRNHPSRTPPKPPRPVSSVPPSQHTSQPHSKPRPSSSSGSLAHRTPITGDVPFPPSTDIVKCPACSKPHAPGRCPLRDVEIQQCPGCGHSHLHLNRTCPLLQKPEYVDMMHQRLKESTEDKDVLNAAKSYISGVKADWTLRQAGGRNRKADKP
jgi:hypothetical protein